MTAAVGRAAAGASRTATATRTSTAARPPASTPPPAPAPQPKPTPAPAPARSGRRWQLPTAPRVWGSERPSSSVAGAILGLLAWAWVGVPLLRGGPTEVRNTLRAKFFNKGPKGEWLP